MLCPEEAFGLEVCVPVTVYDNVVAGAPDELVIVRDPDELVIVRDPDELMVAEAPDVLMLDVVLATKSARFRGIDTALGWVSQFAQQALWL